MTFQHQSMDPDYDDDPHEEDPEYDDDPREEDCVKAGAGAGFHSTEAPCGALSASTHLLLQCHRRHHRVHHLKCHHHHPRPHHPRGHGTEVSKGA